MPSCQGDKSSLNPHNHSGIKVVLSKFSHKGLGIKSLFSGPGSWSLPEAFTPDGLLSSFPPARGFMCHPTAGSNVQNSYRNLKGSLASPARLYLHQPSLVKSLPQVLSSWHLSINFRITRPMHSPMTQTGIPVQFQFPAATPNGSQLLIKFQKI